MTAPQPPGEPSYLPGTDMPRFIRELMEFVELGEADVEAVRRTAPVVLAHEAAFTDALYAHFLKFPATARFFLGEDGTPDAARLERRKHSLARWLRQTAEVATTQEFSYYLLAVGLSHSHRAHGPGGVVPPHFIVGAMSLAQSALARLFRAELADPQAALDASLAWNKLLLVHLAVLLLGYIPPARR
ncbi:MAG TPA: protoglobin family protein [Methylomirabilota bacterium]|nr:protoglobin family protein [Methylomirabilota bacterium]